MELLHADVCYKVDLDPVIVIFVEKYTSIGFNVWKSKIFPNRGNLEAICPRRRTYTQTDHNSTKSIYLYCILKSYDQALNGQTGFYLGRQE